MPDLRPCLLVYTFTFLLLTGCSATPAQHVPDATQVLEGRLFDSTSGEVIEEGVVVIVDDAVACSGARHGCEWPEETPVRTFENETLLAGLIDLHVHARPHYLGAFLPAGVTTVRDANNTLGLIHTLRTAASAPRIFASGPLLTTPQSVISQMSTTSGSLGDYPPEEIMPIHVEGTAEAEEAVETLAEAGVDLIKLYEHLSHETFEAAVTAARARGVPVAADLGMIFTQGLEGEVDIVEAARAGVTSIEHLSGLSLAYERRGGDPMAEELDEALLDEIATELAETDAAVVPSLAGLMQFANPRSLSLEGLPGADRLPPHFEEHWNQLLGWAEQEHDRFAAGLRLKQALLRRLHEQGMLIGAGSDLPAAPHLLPGAALHQELEALVMAGLSPTDALRAATSTAAAILGREDLGHLSPGAKADVVVVDGDPTEDILATRSIAAVWKDGEEINLESAWDAVEAQLEALGE